MKRWVIVLIVIMFLWLSGLTYLTAFYLTSPAGQLALLIEAITWPDRNRTLCEDGLKRRQDMLHSYFSSQWAPRGDDPFFREAMRAAQVAIERYCQ